LSALLAALRELAAQHKIDLRSIPTEPRKLIALLKRLGPALRSAGIVHRPSSKTDKERIHELALSSTFAVF